MNVIQQRQKAMLDSIKENARQAITSSFESLIENHPNQQIPEKIFVDHFLPLFTGRKVTNAETATFAQWVAIAGTATSEVDVIDSNGEVLYTVPAIYDTKGINVADRSREQGMFTIAQNYHIENTNIPQIANNNLHHALESVSQDNVASAAVDDRWNVILKRYDLITEDKAVQQTPNNGDFLIYD